MDELTGFALYLAFGGFLFLSVTYVVRVVFWLSPHKHPPGVDHGSRSWPGHDALSELEGETHRPAEDAMGLSRRPIPRRGRRITFRQVSQPRGH